MDDYDAVCSAHNTDLEQRASPAAADEHREALVYLEDSDRVIVRVQHVLVADPVPPGAGRDDRLGTDDDKLACQRIERKGACSLGRPLLTRPTDVSGTCFRLATTDSSDPTP